MISYRCPDCGSDDEQFHHSSAPASIQCRGMKVNEAAKETVKQEIKNDDGTLSYVLVEVELAPTLSACAGTALRREALPGELWARPARGFEPLVIYQNAADPTKFSFPGRNNEPTDAGYKRIEITNMAQYNKWAKHINSVEVAKMSDHREMHKEYWGARRNAMRDDVNARIRHNPVLLSLSRLIRARSDNKTNQRYGKPLDSRFHSQLLEFNQSNMQDWCAEDSGGRKGWQSRRAK